MAVEPLAGHAAAVVNGASLALEGIVIREDDAALTGRDQLAGLEAERCRGSEAADLASLPFASMSVSRIFDQRDTVAVGDIPETIEVRGMPTHVYRDNCPGARRDCGFGQFRIETVTASVNVHKHRQCVREEHGAGSGDESEVRDDDLIAGLHA